MSLLKTEPPRPVRSLGELFAIAHGMEHEAAAHYAALAARLRGVGNTDAATVFERLADDKRGRAADVERWSEERTGAAPDPRAAHWRPQDMLGGGGTEDDASPRLVNAYRAWSQAVRHEERAFVFWSYVVAQAGDPVVRQAAAALAEEKLHRASALRRERRRAFHADRRVASGTHGRQTPFDASPGGWPGGAASLERNLAFGLRELAAASAARGDGDRARTLREMAAETERLAQEVAATHVLAGATGQSPSVPADAPGGASFQTALRLAELAAEHYLAAAEAAKDEAGMLKAQALAERAIARSDLLERISD